MIKNVKTGHGTYHIRELGAMIVKSESFRIHSCLEVTMGGDELDSDLFQCTSNPWGHVVVEIKH